MRGPGQLPVSWGGGGPLDPDNAFSAASVDKNSVYGTNNITQVNGGWLNVTGNLFSANPGAGEINVVEWINQAAATDWWWAPNKGIYCSNGGLRFCSLELSSGDRLAERAGLRPALRPPEQRADGEYTGPRGLDY